jgi:hypothetical protein
MVKDRLYPAIDAFPQVSVLSLEVDKIDFRCHNIPKSMLHTGRHSNWGFRFQYRNRPWALAVSGNTRLPLKSESNRTTAEKTSPGQQACPEGPSTHPPCFLRLFAK